MSRVRHVGGSKITPKAPGVNAEFRRPSFPDAGRGWRGGVAAASQELARHVVGGLRGAERGSVAYERPAPSERVRSRAGYLIWLIMLVKRTAAPRSFRTVGSATARPEL